MGSKIYTQEKNLSLPMQMALLKKEYPTATCEYKKNTLYWRAKVTPSSLSRNYQVSVIYKNGKAPHIFVHLEDLESEKIKYVPHCYERDQEKKKVKICLYMHNEFSSKKYLSETIIPWISEWLFFYETWQVTGEWLGGGEHPKIKPKRRSNRFSKKKN